MSDHVGFVEDKVALGQISSEYFGFPCQFSFHRMLHSHHLSSGAGTVGQIAADVPSGLGLTPPQDIKKTLLSFLSAFRSVLFALVLFLFSDRLSELPHEPQLPKRFSTKSKQYG
jgi:hypothetical protein